MSDDRPDSIEDFDEVEQLLQDYIDEYQEFLSWIGTDVEDVSAGSLTLSIPYDEKLTNIRPYTDEDVRPDIHGGIAATLMDTAGGFVLRTELDEPIAVDVATINLTVNYLEPATGDLTATADVVRVGGTIGVSEMTVESTTPDGETREVATGQAAYRIFPQEP